MDKRIQSIMNCSGRNFARSFTLMWQQLIFSPLTNRTQVMYIDGTISNFVSLVTRLDSRFTSVLEFDTSEVMNEFDKCLQPATKLCSSTNQRFKLLSKNWYLKQVFDFIVDYLQFDLVIGTYVILRKKCFSISKRKCAYQKSYKYNITHNVAWFVQSVKD